MKHFPPAPRAAALLLAALCLILLPAAPSPAHQQMAQLQVPDPPPNPQTPGMRPPAQPPGPPPQVRPPAAPTVPQTPNLTGNWMQGNGLYYRIIEKPGTWPAPHTHQVILTKKIPAWLVPWQVGTVSCVFFLKPGATGGSGMVLNLTAGAGIRWIRADITVAGPNQISVQPTEVPVPAVTLTRMP